MSALLASLRRAARGEILEQVPLAPRTSVRVGGPARYWVRPHDPRALVEVLRVLSGEGIGWFSLGGGANTIVGDKGVDGAVLKLAQHFSLPISGSVFVNPPGNFAGRLIEQAGLKGLTRGGAQISEKHANFIVNLGGAKAADVVELIATARKAVLAAAGIELKPEVKLVGAFDPELPQELLPHQIGPVLPEAGAPFEISDPKKSFLRVTP